MNKSGAAGGGEVPKFKGRNFPIDHADVFQHEVIISSGDGYLFGAGLSKH